MKKSRNGPISARINRKNEKILCSRDGSGNGRIIAGVEIDH